MKNLLLPKRTTGIFTAPKGTQFKYGPSKFGKPYGLVVPFDENIDETCVSAVSKFMNDLGYLEIFTSPLNPRERNVFMNFGYTTVETLILLKRSFDSPLPDNKSFQIHKIRQKDLEKILMIDHASFDSFWQFDKTAFLNAKNATPYTRLRMIKEGKEIVAYAITGAGITDGFIQRLAVLPDFQNCGFGTYLLNDGLRWLQRKGVTNTWVNTQPANEAAINLYRKAKFEICEDELAVLSLSTAINKT